MVALLPLRLPGGSLRWVLLVVLALCTLGGVLERERSRNDWQASDKAGLWQALRHGDTVSTYGYRSWNAAGLERATAQLDVRRLSGRAGWDWYRSNSRFNVVRDEGTDYTRVAVPERLPGEGQPYLMRTFDTRESLQNRIFKVLLELRRAPTSGTPEQSSASPPPVQRGEPLGGRNCVGVLLQAWNERGGGRCLPLDPSNDWQRYSLSWRVPAEIDPEAHVVRIILQGFGGETLDLRRVLLFRGLKSLGPLQPQGGALQVAWGEQPEPHSGLSFVPTTEWRTLKLSAVKGANPTDTLSLRLTGGEGLVLQTRNVSVRAPGGSRLAEAVSSPRQTIIFGDPNLAGHTLGTLGLAFVSLASPPWGALGALLSLLSMTLTGSRAALAGVVVGLLWLACLWIPGRRRAGLALSALLLGGAALLLAQFWSPLGTLRLLSFSEITSRSDIWRAAWDAFVAHPWRGLGAGGFSAYWAETHGGEAVRHAHNFWLESAASYGVLGLLSSSALSLALVHLAFRWGGARALALVGGVLVMNVFDTTLSYGGVLFTLTLALGIFKPPLEHFQPVVRRSAHNTGVVASHLPQAPNE